MKGYVKRVFGWKKIDMFCRVGQSGGGIGRSLWSYGSEYLQDGEVEILANDGVKEITLAEVLRLEYEEQHPGVSSDPNQLALF